MQLLVAYELDPAGSNMAGFISQSMKKENDIFHAKHFDLVVIPTPAISADWLEEKYDYDGFVFLSKHASDSGTLALTCHSTGNFSEANFGGTNREVAIPHPHLQKTYIQSLWEKREEFSSFQITIEATHHGPTALNKPALFIEIGTTEKEWNDKNLCNSVAKIVIEVISQTREEYPVALCFGGTHYPEKFTKELIEGEYALGTVVPRHALKFLDQRLFDHILQRNTEAKFTLLDWNGLGKYKQKVVSYIETTDLEMIKL
ncbi:MAG: D-aminoacyl-tRNA deacylase, partial [Nitrosopumilaceae archaeon]